MVGEGKRGDELKLCARVDSIPVEIRREFADVLRKQNSEVSEANHIPVQMSLTAIFHKQNSRIILI